MATESEAKIGALEALAKFLNAAAALATLFAKELERDAASAAAGKDRK
jgi:hypothetical protein